MEKPHPLLFDIQSLVVNLALINRMHYLAGHDQAENDIVHSFAVAMLCWFICEKYKINLDLEKILKYALAHDFVERYAGDTNAYADKTAREKKIELEKASLARLSHEFQDFGGLTAALHAYETKADDESRFVWTVDKMQAIIMGSLDGWRLYQNLDISYEKFAEKNAELLALSSPYCKEIFHVLIEYSKTTYYDRPGPSGTA